mgnify:FL=1|tara:strand:- start:127 stop:582 length:456 start_codon:yes stop_codon:yes gene_type:complete
MFNSRVYRIAKRLGFRSGLECKVAEDLKSKGIKFGYETIKIEWEDLCYRTYTPDFILHNNIIVETKGYWTSTDRRKLLCIKKQHPDLDIRIVFTNSRTKLRKGAKSSYAEWCIKHKFEFADKRIPEEWLKEKSKPKLPKFINFKLQKIKRK